MAKSNYDLAKELVAKLDQDQLAGLSHHIEFFQKNKSFTTVMIPRTEDICLFENIKIILAQRVNTNYPPISVWLLKFPNTYRTLRTRATEIEEFIAANFKPGLSRSQKNKLYVIFSSVVATRIEQTRVPLSLTTTLSFFNNLPGLIDKSFPGYIQSGLLDALLKFNE